MICWGEICVIIGSEIGSIINIETNNGLNTLNNKGVFNFPFPRNIKKIPYIIPIPTIIKHKSKKGYENGWIFRLNINVYTIINGFNNVLNEYPL